MKDSRRYCPACAGPLEAAELSGHRRLRCTDPDCGYVFWDNPVPVVAAIVEHEGALILARNVAWPPKMFGLVTGFLEPREHPETGVVREVEEELGLDATLEGFVGTYPFPRMNQLVLAYHLTASGPITLNEELAEYKRLAPERVRYWPASTGWAVKDWLEARGYEPREVELPPNVRAMVSDH
ncbi:NUDIX hydrolase [Salinisphaera sp. PC39]|uniref:NUDIX domain-containing protein n=1 Tax=Salinisphaera sp. PC39 TaxID=1304156 RepID=UPI0033420B02